MPAEPLPTEVSLVRVEGLLPGASNATLLAVDKTDSPWVYKPDRGEQPLWDFPAGTLSLREVACFRISEEFGLGVVPETRLADGPYGPGSAQRYLNEDFSWDPRPLLVEAAEALWPVAILDIITNNADRKIGHLLRQPGTEEIWAIDNGLTFHPEDKLRTVLWAFGGQTIPEVWLSQLQPDRLPGLLAGLVSPLETEITISRTIGIQENPTHPYPPANRPAMPWPLW